jgi:hypothetical protein
MNYPTFNDLLIACKQCKDDIKAWHVSCKAREDNPNARQNILYLIEHFIENREERYEICKLFFPKETWQFFMPSNDFETISILRVSPIDKYIVENIKVQWPILKQLIVLMLQCLVRGKWTAVLRIFRHWGKQAKERFKRFMNSSSRKIR